MANSDTFTATTTWQAIEANGADITTGTFTVFNLGIHRVGLRKSDVLPTEQNGDFYLEKPQDSVKITLSATEELYCKTDTGTAEIGVIPS